MLIRCTVKLLKEMELKPVDLAVATEFCEPFTEWYAHVFVLDRKKQVIFVEVQTLFSFCVENVSRKDIRERLPEMFEKWLGRALFVEGVSGQVMSKVLDVCRGELAFAKTESRKTIGAMNEFVKHHKFSFEYQDRTVDVQDQCNRYMPMRGFPNGTKDYELPIEVFTKVLKEQFGLDFTPHKENCFRKIFSQKTLEV